MKNISLFLAIKYFKSKGKGFVSFHSGIAIFGIAVGVIILILATSVMNGFQRESVSYTHLTLPTSGVV